jgi:hypothetical protein
VKAAHDVAARQRDAAQLLQLGRVAEDEVQERQALEVTRTEKGTFRNLRKEGKRPEKDDDEQQDKDSRHVEIRPRI